MTPYSSARRISRLSRAKHYLMPERYFHVAMPAGMRRMTIAAAEKSFISVATPHDGHRPACMAPSPIFCLLAPHALEITSRLFLFYFGHARDGAALYFTHRTIGRRCLAAKLHTCPAISHSARLLSPKKRQHTASTLFIYMTCRHEDQAACFRDTLAGHDTPSTHRHRVILRYFQAFSSPMPPAMSRRRF